MGTTVSLVVDNETIIIDNTKGVTVKPGVFIKETDKSTDATMGGENPSGTEIPVQSAVNTFVKDSISGAVGIGFNPRTEYSGGTRYRVNDVVPYNGALYVCIQAGYAPVPDAEGGDDWWQLMLPAATPGTNGADGIGFSPRTEYSGGTGYNVNDVVPYNGALYVCIQAGYAPAPDAEGGDDWWQLMLPAATPGTNGADGAIIFPFSYGDATPAIIASIPAGTLISSIAICVLTEFDGLGASLSIGVDGIGADTLMTIEQNTPMIISEFVTYPMYTFTEEKNILLYITPGTGATRGSGIILINSN